jgi:polyferredoxin
VLLVIGVAAGLLCAPPSFTWGIVCGGVIVTANFYLLARTLRKALRPPYVTSHNLVLAKYYIRFLISGFIIFVLLAGGWVNPVGLIIGLSVVVASIILATMNELTILIRKEAH